MDKPDYPVKGRLFVVVKEPLHGWIGGRGYPIEMKLDEILVGVSTYDNGFSHIRVGGMPTLRFATPDGAEVVPFEWVEPADIAPSDEELARSVAVILGL